MGPSKRVCYGDNKFEETLQWYEETDSNVSDVGSVTVDFAIHSNHNSGSELSMQ